jgi:hypothetical protein
VSAISRRGVSTVLLRDQGERHTVTVVPNGYLWRETTYAILVVDFGEYGEVTITQAIRIVNDGARIAGILGRGTAFICAA